MSPIALSIPVEPSESIVAAGMRTKSSLFARICGHCGGTRRRGGEWVDLDMHGLAKPLLVDLTEYLHERFSKPWKATRWFLESYLHGVEHEVVLRGTRRKKSGRWRWALQLRFSQCAAMAEVSAQVATHWARPWLTERCAELEQSVLAPGGLTPTVEPIEFAAGAERFLPVGEMGYAAYTPDPLADYRFDLDGACHVNDPDAALRALRHLEDYYADAMDDERCRCQICMPDFAAEQCTPAGMLA